MSSTMKCPYCPTSVHVPGTALVATCPNCHNTFKAVPEKVSSAKSVLSRSMGAKSSPPLPRSAVVRQDQLGSASDNSASDGDNSSDRHGSWTNYWGLASLACAAVGVLQAFALRMYAPRWLTTWLAILGLLCVAGGLWTLRKKIQNNDRVWFTIGGCLNVLVLLIMLLAPGVLNYWWDLDKPVAKTDPNHLMKAPYDRPRESKPLEGDEWLDAHAQAYVQDDAYIRIESVKVDVLPDKGSAKYVQIHLRLANFRSGSLIMFEGFPEGKHTPVLTDEAGRTYQFVEQRERERNRTGILKFLPIEEAKVFELAPSSAGATSKRYSSQDLLLIFSPGAADPLDSPLQLELPCSAWGRQGTCKFRISALYKSRFRDKDD